MIRGPTHIQGEKITRGVEQGAEIFWAILDPAYHSMHVL